MNILAFLSLIFFLSTIVVNVIVLKDKSFSIKKQKRLELYIQTFEGKTSAVVVILLTSLVTLCIDASNRLNVMSIALTEKTLSKNDIYLFHFVLFSSGALIVDRCCAYVKYKQAKRSIPVQLYNIRFSESNIESFLPQNQQLLRNIQTRISNILLLHESHEKLQTDFNNIYLKNLKQEDIDKLEACSYISCELKEKLYTQEEEKQLQEEVYIFFGKMSPLLDFIVDQMRSKVSETILSAYNQT